MIKLLQKEEKVMAKFAMQKKEAFEEFVKLEIELDLINFHVELLSVKRDLIDQMLAYKGVRNVTTLPIPSSASPTHGRGVSALPTHSRQRSVGLPKQGLWAETDNCCPFVYVRAVKDAKRSPHQNLNLGTPFLVFHANDLIQILPETPLLPPIPLARTFSSSPPTVFVTALSPPPLPSVGPTPPRLPLLSVGPTPPPLPTLNATSSKKQLKKPPPKRSAPPLPSLPLGGLQSIDPEEHSPPAFLGLLLDSDDADNEAPPSPPPPPPPPPDLPPPPTAPIRKKTDPPAHKPPPPPTTAATSQVSEPFLEHGFVRPSTITVTEKPPKPPRGVWTSRASRHNEEGEPLPPRKSDFLARKSDDEIPLPPPNHEPDEAETVSPNLSLDPSQDPSLTPSLIPLHQNESASTPPLSSLCSPLSEGGDGDVEHFTIEQSPEVFLSALPDGLAKSEVLVKGRGPDGSEGLVSMDDVKALFPSFRKGLEAVHANFVANRESLVKARDEVFRHGVFICLDKLTRKKLVDEYRQELAARPDSDLTKAREFDEQVSLAGVEASCETLKAMQRMVKADREMSMARHEVALQTKTDLSMQWLDEQEHLADKLNGLVAAAQAKKLKKLSRKNAADSRA